MRDGKVKNVKIKMGGGKSEEVKEGEEVELRRKIN